MSFPEWIKKTTVKSGPCRMCGPKCNDADMLFKALEIAWEALEKTRSFGRPLEAPRASYAVCDINDITNEAMKRIEEKE